MKIDMSRVRSITRLLLFLAVALSFIGANLVAKADDMAYMATGGGSFGTIDLTTGVYTQLGLSQYPLMGLAVMGTTLYGAGSGNNQAGQLWSVNPANGLLTAIGQPTGIQYQAFGSLNNTLYVIDHTSANPNLYSIDSSTGAATLIGHLNIGPLAGYWSLSTNSTALYFQLNSTLYTLNTTTGQAVPVGALGGQLQAGAIVEVNGTLYAGQDNTSAAPLEILALNKSTGAATVVSSVSGVGLSYIFGLAPIISSFASSDTFFPQVAVGGGYTTIFTISNTGATAASGVVTLTDQNADAFLVNGTLTDSSGTTQPATTGSSFAFNVPSGGTIFLSVTTSSSIKAGWAEIASTGGTLTAVATYYYTVGSVVQSIVGVLQTQPLQYMTFPVDNDTVNQLNTVYGIANPGSQAITVKAALVGQDGTVIEDITLPQLGPGTQMATYLYQTFSGQTNFKGSLVLRGQNGATFVAVALNYKQNLLTVIPLISGKAPGVPN